MVTCPRCGRTSHHPEDVRQGYCSACHDWTSCTDTGPKGWRCQLAAGHRCDHSHLVDVPTLAWLDWPTGLVVTSAVVTWGVGAAAIRLEAEWP